MSPREGGACLSLAPPFWYVRSHVAHGVSSRGRWFSSCPTGRVRARRAKYRCLSRLPPVPCVPNMDPGAPVRAPRSHPPLAVVEVRCRVRARVEASLPWGAGWDSRGPPRRGRAGERDRMECRDGTERAIPVPQGCRVRQPSHGGDHRCRGGRLPGEGRCPGRDASQDRHSFEARGLPARMW